MIDRALGFFAGILGASAVAIGAFASHLLNQTLPADRLAVIETAARYQLVHAVAILAVAVAVTGTPSGLRIAGRLFVSGILLFSGSLYIMIYTGVKQIGMITPVGGALLIAGWITIAFSSLRGQRSPQTGV